MNLHTSELLVELEDIVKSNSIFAKVTSSEPVVPLAQDTEGVSAYILMPSIQPKNNGIHYGINNYDLHSFYTITINVDCTRDKNLIYDVVDSLQRSILNDSGIWNKLVDRDIITVEFDNAEFYPKRTAVVALEVIYRLTCE
jgi:hypothetical protein